jgi:hypothetical protein
MIDRRTGAVLAVLISLVAGVLLAACSQASEPEPAASPSTSPSATAPLALGQSAAVAGFTMTPTAVRDRPGPVYDLKGKSFKGHGIKITIEVAKDREADLAAGELTVPVATVADATGQTVQMDDYLGMVPLAADSPEYSKVYARSYQYACIQSPGNTTKGTLWFSLPEGFVPEKLIMDGGAGAQASWLLK